MSRPDTDHYRELFLRDTPLLDTRAPVEFSKGAFPGAVNLPLMDDVERHEIGIRYKEQGQQAAIALGHELVCGDLKRERIAGWCEFARKHPDGYIYCFRGGLRSQTVQQWMREAGVDFPLVLGGYKALRRFLLEQLESDVAAAEFILIAGKTGTGKTRVVESLGRAIDLEGLAHHRGSTFGRLLESQPTQIDFENALAIALMRKLASARLPVVLEDEGRLVGRVALPQSLREKMEHSSLLVVEETLEERVQVIVEDYVIDLGRRYAQGHGDEGRQLHQQHLLEGLERIQKRLGGDLHRELDRQIEAAFLQQWLDGNLELHKRWIETLLLEYYDPMYEYQMSKREGAVLARGSRAEILGRARELSGGE